MRALEHRLAVSRRAALRVLLAAAAGDACAAAAPPLQAGALAEFRVELPVALHRLAGPVRVAHVAVATPPAFDAALPWPVLIVCATSDPGHQSSRQLMTAYRASAAAAGWVALAADPDPDVEQDEDTLSMRFALLRAALAAVQPLWRDAGRSPLAFAGFSGGAKYAGWLAALFASQRSRVAGIFLSGVNEDPVAQAARQLGVLDDAFLAVPVFLQGGRADTVATPARHRALEAELRERGFRSLRLGLVPGAHGVDATWLQAALEWFAAGEAIRSPGTITRPRRCNR